MQQPPLPSLLCGQINTRYNYVRTELSINRKGPDWSIYFSVAFFGIKTGSSHIYVLIDVIETIKPGRTREQKRYCVDYIKMLVAIALARGEMHKKYIHERSKRKILKYFCICVRVIIYAQKSVYNQF